MPRNHEILTTLRTLDPADHLPGPRTMRARADLERIVQTAPDHEHAGRIPRPPVPRATRSGRPRGRVLATRRILVAGAVVAAVTATVVTLPSLTGGDSAFATWTQTPQGLSAEDRAAAARACREQQQDGPGGDYRAQLSAAAPAIVESRGAWTTVVLAAAGGFSAMCITDESTRLFRSWIGSVGTPSDDAPPAPRQVAATDLGTGSVDSAALSLAAGVAGSDVTAIAYDSQEHGEVRATVSQGHFALWFPGNELESASRDGVDVQVTYRDGTTTTTRLQL